MGFKQKCLYMGIGFLFTSLGWLFATLTVVDAEKESDDEWESARFDAIACSRLYLVDENDQAVMAMEVMPKRGPTFMIIDTAFREDGTESKKHLSLYRDGLVIYNENGDSVVGVGVRDEGGIFLTKNKQDQLTWIIEANKHAPIRQESPSTSIEPLDKK